MKRFCHVLFIALTILAVVSTPAHAIPRKWRGTPEFTRAGVTYRVRERVAVVTRTTGRNVTIPAEIQYRGKYYEVRGIWSGAFKGAKVITIHADLESCDAWRLGNRSVRVRATRTSTYRFLRRINPNTTKIECPDCK